MSSSSSKKKLHYFNMSDNEGKQSNQESNPRLMRREPVSPPACNRTQPMDQNGSKSTKADEKKTLLDKKSKVAKEEAVLLEEKEAKPAGNQTSKTSTSKVPSENFEHNKYLKPKLSISLTREEIEEDFFLMTGRKLPRNMKKRDKDVQKDLDALFPGLSLEGRNADNLPKY